MSTDTGYRENEGPEDELRAAAATRAERFADLGFISIRGRMDPSGCLTPPPGHEHVDRDLTTLSCTDPDCGSSRRYAVTVLPSRWACACSCHTEGAGVRT